MRVCTIYWSPEKDITTCEFSNDFDEIHYVAQLDILQDVMVDLKSKYDEIYDEHYLTLDSIKKLREKK
jgi:hypothetical protein